MPESETKTMRIDVPASPDDEPARIHARIPVELHARLRAAKIEEGRPMREIVVDALDQHLPTPDTPDDEA